MIAVLVGCFVLMSCMSGDVVGWIYHGVAHKYVEGYGSFFWRGVAVFTMISVLLLRRVAPPHGPPTGGTEVPQ